jgi:hypothetical protein
MQFGSLSVLRVWSPVVPIITLYHGRYHTVRRQPSLACSLHLRSPTVPWELKSLVPFIWPLEHPTFYHHRALPWLSIHLATSGPYSEVPTTLLPVTVCLSSQFRGGDVRIGRLWRQRQNQIRAPKMTTPATTPTMPTIAPMLNVEPPPPLEEELVVDPAKSSRQFCSPHSEQEVLRTCRVWHSTASAIPSFPRARTTCSRSPRSRAAPTIRRPRRHALRTHRHQIHLITMRQALPLRRLLKRARYPRIRATTPPLLLLALLIHPQAQKSIGLGIAGLGIRGPEGAADAELGPAAGKLGGCYAGEVVDAGGGGGGVEGGHGGGAFLWGRTGLVSIGSAGTGNGVPYH